MYKRRTAGIFSVIEGALKDNPNNESQPYFNNITLRNIELPERIRTVSPSKNMFEANLKSLRLYRKICRMMPMVLKFHDMKCKVTPVQAKINVGNLFRKNAGEKNLTLIDQLVDQGYETQIEFEWHYAPQQYIYKFVAPCGTHRDMARDLIDERFNTKNKKSSKFLKDFYNAPKSHVL